MLNIEITRMMAVYKVLHTNSIKPGIYPASSYSFCIALVT